MVVWVWVVMQPLGIRVCLVGLSSVMSISESSVVVVVSDSVVAGSLRNVEDGGSSVRLTSLHPSDGM